MSESESVGYCRLGETLFTSVFIADFSVGGEPVFSLWYGRRQGNHRENLLSYNGN